MAKPSSEVEVILSIPEMPLKASSMRSTTSRSHLRRRGAGVGDGDEDDRVREVRELVDVEIEQGEDAEDDQRQHRHDGDDGALDGEIGDGHSAAARRFRLPAGRPAPACTGVPGAISCAAPSRTTSPAATPARISTSLRVLVDQAELHLDALDLAVADAQHRRLRHAAIDRGLGSVRPVRVSLATRPSA